MACISNVEAPTVRVRRRKSAKEKREQKCRSIARAFQTVASALHNVRCHRGGALQEVGISWMQHVLRPKTNEIPLPNFIPKRTYSNVVLQPCIESEDAAGSECSERDSMRDSQHLQDEESEHLSSEGEDQESEELVSRSPSESEGAHSNVALSQPSGSEASDDESEDAVHKKVVDGDPENQILFRKIHLPAMHRPEKLSFVEIAGSDYCREFGVGDLVRPQYCLANLNAYRNGAIGQVVGLDVDQSLIILSFFDDKGNLMDERILHFAEHFERICTVAIFDEKPYIPRSTMLERNGAILLICAKYSADSRPSAASV